MNSEFYETSIVKKIKVIYTDYPPSYDKTLAKIKADINYVYPIGTPGFLSFERATWVLASDGIVTVKLLLNRPNASEVITVAGVLNKYKEVNSLHVEGKGLYGLKVTMDGLLDLSSDGYHIIGIFTIKVQDAWHAEWVELNISQIRNLPSDNWASPIIENVRQNKILEQSIIEKKTLLSEPAEWISGVPIPTNFDVTLKIKLDGTNIPLMKGQLFLYRVEGLAEPKIGLTIGTEGSVVPGWSFWTTNPNIYQDQDPTFQVSKPIIQQLYPLILHPSQPNSAPKSVNYVEVIAESGHIRATIASAPLFGQVYWYAHDSKKPMSTFLVLVDKGTIDLQIKNEYFSGTISAQGTMSEGTRSVSTFIAELSGYQQGRRFVKDIANYTGPLPFDGLWYDPILGELKLNQRCEEVNGTFSDSGTIRGFVIGKVLNVCWRKANGDKGRGFLSATRNGLIVGMIWKENKYFTPEPIVAVQVMLPVTEPNSKAGDVPLPKSDAEAEQLKLLGYDLSAANKHQEATRVLFKVVTYFRNRAEASENALSAYGGYLISQALPLYTLINSAFEAGDYPTLVESISIAIDLQRKLGKGSADRRSFLEHAEKYIAELNKHAETMDNLAAGFDRGQKFLFASGIGISLDEESTDSGIKISDMRLNMPADKAGVNTGDLLVEIDGVPVAGMSQEQVSVRLYGLSGTSVCIKLIRNGQPLKIKLVRAPLVNLMPDQKNKISRAMSDIHNIAINTSQDYRVEAYELNKLLNRDLDVLAVFKELTTHLERSQKSIEDGRITVIDLAERCLIGSQIGVSLLQRFVSSHNKFVKDMKQEEYSIQIQKLDQEVDDFEHSPDVSDIYKSLLRISILTIGEFDNMRVETHGRLRMVKEAADFSTKLASPIQIADSLSKLAEWLDKWRSQMVTDTARIESLQYGQEFYESYVKILLELNLPEQALLASETARARAFADLLISSQKTQTDFGQAVSSEGVLLNPASIPPLSIKEIKDMAIFQNRTIIEYFLLNDFIVIWVISPKGKIDMIQVPVDTNQLDTNIKQLVVLMAPNCLCGRDGRELRSQVSILLKWLDKCLITPLINKNLLSTNSKKEVIIIPHKTLFLVPFAALLDGENQYFVEKYSLSYTASLLVLKYTQNNYNYNTPSEINRHLLALVSPDPLPYSEKLPQNPLLSLPKTGELFRNHIAGFYAPTEISNIHFGQDANEAVLREKASYADVLYFATHAEVNEKEPLKSFIALAKTDRFSGYFRVADIYSLNLQAELTILAACETGGGRISGDGVNGLSRAFTLAGSSTLLMSLWGVPEEKTSLAMIWFHHFWLQKKMDKAASLQNAQLELLKNYRTQPNLWAGFVLFGNPN